jgi:hypothetical protein
MSSDNPALATEEPLFEDREYLLADNVENTT